jgi:hypothetical protein
MFGLGLDENIAWKVIMTFYFTVMAYTKFLYPAYYSALCYIVYQCFKAFNSSFEQEVKTLNPSSNMIRKYREQFSKLCQLVDTLDNMTSAFICVFYLCYIVLGCVKINHLCNGHFTPTLVVLALYDILTNGIIPLMLFSVMATLINE